MSVSMNWSVSFSQEKNIYEGLLDLDFLYYFYIFKELIIYTRTNIFGLYDFFAVNSLVI